MRLHVAAPVDAESVGHPGTQPAPKRIAPVSTRKRQAVWIRDERAISKSCYTEAWVCGANAGFQRNGAH